MKPKTQLPDSDQPDSDQRLKELPASMEPTLNSTGFMIQSLDEVSQAFVDFAAGAAPGPALDIGAGFGAATLPALKRGASVTANDCQAEHLQILSDRTPPEDLARLTLLEGAFPDELKIAADSLGAVIVSRVMHFFDGAQVERSADLLFDWLRPGGKVFIVCEASIFLRIPKLRQIYERQRSQGARWPGFVENVNALLPEKKDRLPDQLHYLDEEILARTFKDAGFQIQQAKLFRRSLDDGSSKPIFRSSVGLVALKKYQVKGEERK